MKKSCYYNFDALSSAIDKGIPIQEPQKAKKIIPIKREYYSGLDYEKCHNKLVNWQKELSLDLGKFKIMYGKTTQTKTLFINTKKSFGLSIFGYFLKGVKI